MQQLSFAPRATSKPDADTASNAATASQPPQAAAPVDAKGTRPRQDAASSPKAPRKGVVDPSPPPAPVVPAWRNDAAAIASIIESRTYQDTVSPVARLYFAYFERGPDLEGLDHYVAQHEGGRPLEAIADEFAGSQEIELRYGALDDAAFVDRVLRNVFDGAGNEQLRQLWIERLQSGAMSRGQMMLAFSEGAAFRAATANEVLVSLAYAEIFGRHAEPTELSRWVAFLDAGNSADAFVRGLLAAR